MDTSVEADSQQDNSQSSSKSRGVKGTVAGGLKTMKQQVEHHRHLSLHVEFLVDIYMYICIIYTSKMSLYICNCQCILTNLFL